MLKSVFLFLAALIAALAKALRPTVTTGPPHRCFERRAPLLAHVSAPVFPRKDRHRVKASTSQLSGALAGQLRFTAKDQAGWSASRRVP